MKASRQMQVFFYGLFMDQALLKAKGVRPGELKSGRLRGYQLRIGSRATLVPADGAIVHGMLAELSEQEVQRLYSEPSVADYRPYLVTVEMAGGRAVSATCFTLEEAPKPTEHNLEYALRLRALAEKLNFPPEYVASIQ